MSKRVRDEDELDDAALAKLLFTEARNGTLDDVKAAIEAGADAKHISSEGRTATMQACIRRDDQEALAIVRYLVEECKASGILRVPEDKGNTCLHYAAFNGSLGLVRYLLEKASTIVNTCNLHGLSALFGASQRCDRDGIDIARALLDAGAELHVSDKATNRPLHYACCYSTAGMVDLLLSRGAGIDGVGANGPPIFDAVLNREHGVAIIDLLNSRGANLTLKSTDGDLLPSFSVVNGSSSVIAALVPLIQTTELSTKVYRVNGNTKWNFVGNIREGRSWGANSKSPGNTEGSSDEIWCMMRARKDVDVNVITQTLSNSNPEVWEHVINDLWIHFNDQTILHKTVRSNELEKEGLLQVLHHIARRFVNPYVLDADGKKAIEYCDAKKSPEAYKFLSEYQAWSWGWQKTAWFGPLFKQRAITLMLCLRQMGYYSRDVRGLLLQQLARTEYLFA